MKLQQYRKFGKQMLFSHYATTSTNVMQKIKAVAWQNAFRVHTKFCIDDVTETYYKNKYL